MIILFLAIIIVIILAIAYIIMKNKKVASCTLNSDCAASQYCASGRCINTNTCTTSAACAPGQTCIGNKCIIAGEPCITSSDCLSEEACVNLKCVPVFSCYKWIQSTDGSINNAFGAGSFYLPAVYDHEGTTFFGGESFTNPYVFSGVDKNLNSGSWGGVKNFKYLTNDPRCDESVVQTFQSTTDPLKAINVDNTPICFQHSTVYGAGNQFVPFDQSDNTCAFSTALDNPQMIKDIVMGVNYP